MPEGEEVKRKEVVGRCVGVLAGVVDTETRILEKTVEPLVKNYPRVNAVRTCESLRDYASKQPVQNLPALLGRFFERAAEEVAAEPMNPHSPEGERARAKPRAMRWYAAAYEDVPNVEAEVLRSIDAGLDHAAIVEELEGLQRERERPGELPKEWVERLLSRSNAGKARR